MSITSAVVIDGSLIIGQALDTFLAHVFIISVRFLLLISSYRGDDRLNEVMSYGKGKCVAEPELNLSLADSKVLALNHITHCWTRKEMVPTNAPEVRECSGCTGTAGDGSDSSLRRPRREDGSLDTTTGLAHPTSVEKAPIG